jgi:putative PIN family toxin of toxin-antitoxin system
MMHQTDGNVEAPRVVIDTNIFVAAAYAPRSSSRLLLEAIEAERIRLLISRPVFREYRRIISQAVRKRDAVRRLQGALRKAEPIDAGRGPRRVPDDPDDDKFLELAEVGRADLLISNDHHLLELQGRFPFAIRRPRSVQTPL